MQRAFRLQKVLNYRQLVLEREKAKLAELMQKESQFLRQIQSINELIKDKNRELVKESDFQVQDMYRKYIVLLERARNQVQKALLEHRKALAQQKDVAVGAYKDKTIMDKLNDRHQKEYQKYIDRKEALEIDDIVITRKAGEIINSEEE